MTSDNPIKRGFSHAQRNRIISGLILILLGGLFLVDQFIQIPAMGNLFLPGLGIVFLLWGIVTRSSGLLIPGGVLSGIGLGVYLMEVLSLEGEQEPGIFLISFGGGFALITLLSLIFTRDKHWWALIPGGILAAIGGALFVGGTALEVLQLVGKMWPVALILFGVWVIFRRR